MPENTEIITKPERLESVIDELLASARISLDVESDGFHNYHDRVCIVTLSSEDRNFVVDTLALGEDSRRLQRLLDRPDVPVLMHSGHNDVLALKRAYRFEFGMVQDTALAVSLLGYAQTGLAVLAETFLGLHLEKDLQRHDWSRRPIELEQVRYLINDTRHLFRIHDLIWQELEKHELADEYRIECDAVRESEPREREFDPERFRKIRGALDLDDTGRGVLKALYAWRNNLARTLDRAAFRVASDQTLLDLARLRPKAPADLENLRGVGEWLRTNHGQTLLEAVCAGEADPAPLRAPRKPAPEGPRLDPRQRDRLGRLKRWREDEARKRGLGLQAILPTAVMHELVLKGPRTVEELAAVPRVGRSRAQRYGEALLRIVGAKPAKGG